MSGRRGFVGRRPRIVAGLAGGLAAVLVADLLVLGTLGPRWTARAGEAELAAATRSAPAAGGVLAASAGTAAVEVAVPRLGIRSRLVGLRLQRDGALGVPADFHRAGWWTQGGAPGDSQRPVVVVGHVDSRSGPAVFASLEEARRGDVVRVRRADGRTLSYQVFKIEHYSKTAFPAADVYGPSFGPGIRLVTCGGQFDRARGHYRDNLVVYARPYTERGSA